MKKIQKDTRATGKSSKIDPRAFLILDDCLFDDKWTRNKFIRAIFMNGRHMKLFFCMTAQYALGIPPALRTNVDYTFILRDPNVNNRKRLYDNYAGVFPTFEMFCRVMDACTENYECLVIQNNTKSNKLEDQVFWYKAQIHKDYRIGADVFWELNNESSDEDDDGCDESFTPVAYSNKHTKGQHVKIKKRY